MSGDPDTVVSAAAVVDAEGSTSPEETLEGEATDLTAGAAAPQTSALETLNKLFAQLMKRYPKGFATSSMGKFNDVRKWLAGELGLTNWELETYGVGSAGIAHNFRSRWVQNNDIAGNRVPLGAAFLSIPPGEDEEKAVTSGLNANINFVDGSKATSFEAIITFVQSKGSDKLHPRAIQTIAGSKVAQRLLQLFPGTPVLEIEWKGKRPPTHSTPASMALEATPLDPGMLAALKSAFEEANYQAPDGLAGRVISSLAAKPFLLLAGLSGTGKTLLAVALAQWLASEADQVQTVAVGADWTSTHHLMGYPDAFDNTRYVGTPALDLLLQAREHTQRPYFLILDEMNLSHVERYFSDFLSVMESREAIILHGGPDPRANVLPRLPFPSNLFVIGTVNVDETTYMFSPKVIDRANVIEFTVTSAAMTAYLGGDTDFSPAAIRGMGAGYGTSLVEVAGGPAGFDDLDADIADGLRRGIAALFEVLDKAGLQFGFRTAREMIRYFVVNRQLHGEGWDPVQALDAQLIQRLLPRLNGDASKLRPPLLALLAFCARWSDINAAPDIQGMHAYAADLGNLGHDVVAKVCGDVAGRYPLTADKLARMFKRLAEHGFTTAIEA